MPTTRKGIKMVTLEDGQFGEYRIINEDTGEHILIQTDWDYPGLASSFGWSPCTHCRQGCRGRTDGTVDCAKRSVGQHLTSAVKYLDAHIGDSINDPGYFGD